jgi:hypothetical protein
VCHGGTTLNLLAKSDEASAKAGGHSVVHQDQALELVNERDDGHRGRRI